MEFAAAALALGAVVPKLGQIVKEQFNLQKRVRREVNSLREEMVVLEAALRKIAEVPPDQLDEHMKVWVSQVRDLSYDIEDSIDGIMVAYLRGHSPKTHSFKELIRKTKIMFRKGKARRRIANDIRDIKFRILELAERCARYKIPIDDPPVDFRGADPVATVDCPDSLARSDEHTELIGVQEAVDELINMLLSVSDGGNSNQQQVKIVSIVGPVGMGKTTLAKAVHERMPTQFDCRAIVSVGRDPELKGVFRDILLQIDKEKYSGFCAAAAVDEKMCTDEIQALFKNKRYFIILDDIWDTKSWEIIRCALVDCSFGSIIITTTRIYDVAQKAGDVYYMQPLSDDNSRRLFYTRLSAREVQQHTDYETTQLVKIILRSCDGIPLAITTIATLLSNEPKEDWHKVYNSIGLWAEDNIVVDNTRKVVRLSYYDLPNDLKVCLLHLIIFPQNYMIRKDALIWKWVGEGFIREESGVGLFEIGERYFNELINKSMIQPVKIPHTGVIIGCRVLGIVLDMICSIAKETNFITLLDGNEQQTSSEVRFHRLAIHRKFMGERYLPKSHVRSINVISCDTGMMSLLGSFKMLRVLAIEDCSFELEGNANILEDIGNLLHLRYLGLSKTRVDKLPEVNNLKCLEVLDLRQTGLLELPKSVSLLSRLKCLRADGGSTRVPDWIGNLTSLEELSLNDVSSCANFVKQVSKLKELRELKIWIRVLDERSKKSLVKSLGSLQKIQVLHLDGGLWIEDAEWEGYVPPLQLRHLNLRIKSSRLPRWINDSLLPNLSHLSVDVRVLDAEDLVILGNLTELISLELFMPNGVSLDVKSCGVLFPKLRHCYASGMLRFLQGAAPRLESVHFNVILSGLNGASFQCGSLGNHPLLKEVTVEIFYSDIHGATEVEMRLRHAVDVHINRPILHISKYKSYFDEDVEKEDNGELEEDAEWDEWYPVTD